MMTSGRCLATRAWRRSRWKYCAGVVRFATRMLPSAASCRKRSRRAGGVLRARALVAVRQQQRQARRLAPLGQAGDDELVDDHLRRVDEVAELRLPQHERLRRLHRVAVLEAEAGDLASAASCAAPSARARPAATGSARSRWPVLASCSTRWRWENVPRSTSWPVRRIGVPSVSSDAKASDSACAQSMPPSAPTASRRRSSCLTSFGCTVKPSGTRSSSSLSDCAGARRDRGLDLGRGRAVELVLAGRLLVARSAAADLLLELAVARRELVPDLLGRSRVDSSCGDRRPSLDQLLGAQLAHRASWP